VALDSALGQTYPDVEVVVINDASPQRLTWAKRRHKQGNIIWTKLPDEKHGVSAARNHGAFVATGQLLYPLDHDDWLEPEACKWMVEAWQNHGGVIYSDLMLFGQDSQKVWKCEDFGCNAMIKDVLMWNSSLFSKEDLLKVGGWNEGLQFLDDWDLNLRFIEHDICGHHVSKPLAWYRQRPTSRMARLKTDPNAYAEAYARLRAAHVDFFNGRSKSMCCGGGTPTPPPQSGPQGRVRAQPSGDRVLIKYVGTRRGGFFATGQGTGVRYHVPGSGEYLTTIDGTSGVDPKDASGLLALNRGQDFIQV
jgi:glycosyltransferase involved in cell wall biosynthesis